MVVGCGKFIVGTSKFKTIVKIKIKLVRSAVICQAYDTPLSCDADTIKSKMLSNITLFLRI